MRTILVSVNLTEAGEVLAMSYTDDTTSYHTALPLVNVEEAPSLGDYETAEEWRADLGRFASKVATIMRGALLNNDSKPLGESVGYVSAGRNLYIYEVDYDE